LLHVLQRATAAMKQKKPLDERLSFVHAEGNW
jgi:hypothetical protein